ncbi:unnamed protein product [Peniophora sp. CBMAI 1063]|nr:unnamed protein product [Peniophora sp. CBMAI 1063]
MAKAANLSTVWHAAVAPSAATLPWARVLLNAASLYELSVCGSDNLRNLRTALTVKENDPVNEHDLYIHAEMSLLPALPRLVTLNVHGLDLSGSSIHFGDKHVLIAVLKTLLPRRVDEVCVCYSNMRDVDRLDIMPFIESGHLIWDGCKRGLEHLPEDPSVKSNIEIPVSSAPNPEAPLPAPVLQQVNVQAGEAGWGVLDEEDFSDIDDEEVFAGDIGLAFDGDDDVSDEEEDHGEGWGIDIVF